MRNNWLKNNYFSILTSILIYDPESCNFVRILNNYFNLKLRYLSSFAVIWRTVESASLIYIWLCLQRRTLLDPKLLVKWLNESSKRHTHQITKVVCVCTTRVQCKFSICICDANKLSMSKNSEWIACAILASVDQFF